MATTVTCVTPQGRRVVVDLGSLLTPAAREQAREDAIRWIKQFRLVPLQRRHDARALHLS